MKRQREELLDDLFQQVRETLIDFQISPEKADQVGCAVADVIAAHWGGQILYIPKGHHYRISARDQEIYQDSRKAGVSVSDLAQKYGLSTQRTYKVIERVRKEEFNRRHGKLPLEEGENHG